MRAWERHHPLAVGGEEWETLQPSLAQDLGVALYRLCAHTETATRQPRFRAGTRLHDVRWDTEGEQLRRWHTGSRRNDD